MKSLKNNIMNIKYYNITKYISFEKKFIKELLEDPYSTKIFKNFLIELFIFLNKK